MINLGVPVAFLVIGTALAQQPHTLTGDIRFHKGFHSNILNNDRDVVAALVRKGWKTGSDLRCFEAEGAEHNERAWAARVELILEFLFPRKG